MMARMPLLAAAAVRLLNESFSVGLKPWPIALSIAADMVSTFAHEDAPAQPSGGMPRKPRARRWVH